MTKLFISTIIMLAFYTSCSNVGSVIFNSARVEIVEEKDTLEYSVNNETKDSIVNHEDFKKLIGKTWVIGGECLDFAQNGCTIHIKRTNLKINRRGYYVSFKNTSADTAYNVHIKIKVKNNGKEYFKDVAFFNQLYFHELLFGIVWLSDNETVIPPAKISWN